MPIGNGTLRAVSSRHFGWRSHLRWLRQELRSGIGTVPPLAARSDAVAGSTRWRRSRHPANAAFPRVIGGRALTSSNRVYGIFPHAAARTDGVAVMVPVSARAEVC